jgi:hypothetical protein
MKQLLLFAWLPVLAACGAEQPVQSTQAAPSALSTQSAAYPDISGVWMPTAIGPDGERVQVIGPDVPYLPDVAEAMAEIRANYNPVVDDVNRSCLPYGMPHQMTVRAQYPMEVIQTDDEIMLVFELHNDTRHIHMDGRSIPQGLMPTWMGYSVGAWQNGELQVETRGTREHGYPNPQSLEMRVTERVRIVDSEAAGPMLEWELTYNDPLTYSAPVVARNYFRRYPDLQMGEYFCSEDLWRQNLDGRSENIPWR